MMSNIKYASYPTPSVSKRWVEQEEALRRQEVEAALAESDANFLKDFKILVCKQDGQVIVAIEAVMASSVRGMRLLDLEEVLKNKIDVGITVWAEPLGDKNSLRNLRGIEIK